MYLQRPNENEFHLILDKSQIVSLIGDLAKLLDGASISKEYTVIHGKFGYENIAGSIRFEREAD